MTIPRIRPNFYPLQFRIIAILVTSHGSKFFCVNSTLLTMLVWACWYTFQHSQPHMAWPVYYIWKIAIKDVWVGKIPFVVETKAKVILLLQQDFKNGWQLLEPVFLCCRCSGLILRCGSVFSLGEPLTHCWEGPASPFQRWDLRVFCSA